MKRSFKRGVSFGLTSGIITTLGVLVGLNAGTHSKMVVLGGILMIALADAFSDSLGMHIAIESEAKYSQKEIWQSTFSTLYSKFFFALTFAIPVLIFDLALAVIISIIWGYSLLAILSYKIAKREKSKPSKVVAEHLLIATLVIIATHYIGIWISTVFV